MSFKLLFDAQCVHCTNVAKKVRSLGIQNLDVASLHDAEVRRTFQQAGQSVPEVPALIDTDGDRLVVWTGLAMRIRLARLIGYRRAADMLRLLAAEAKARAVRRADAGAASGVQRRRLLGGALGGALAGAGAIVFGTGQPAAAGPAGIAGAVAPVSAAQRDHLLSLTEVRKAVATLGPVEADMITSVTDAEGRSVAILSHSSGQGVTFVEADSADPVALTLVSGSTANSIRYTMTDGRPLVELTRTASGKVDARAVVPGDEGERGVGAFAICLTYCLGAEVSSGCVDRCVGCAGGGVTAIVNCPLCAACAGTTGVKCARQCKPLLGV
jgi:predicted DCC family thiol-disulfide oxidoreductase YuxK